MVKHAMWLLQPELGQGQEQEKEPGSGLGWLVCQPIHVNWSETFYTSYQFNSFSIVCYEKTLWFPYRPLLCFPLPPLKSSLTSTPAPTAIPLQAYTFCTHFGSNKEKETLGRKSTEITIADVYGNFFQTNVMKLMLFEYVFVTYVHLSFAVYGKVQTID